MRNPARSALVAAVLSTSLTGVVAVASPGSPAPTELAGDQAVSAMVDLETKMTDSLQVGHAVPVIFDSSAQLPGHVVAAPYWGDTQLWTGVYVGGESMRYALAQHYLDPRGKSAGKGSSDTAPGHSQNTLTDEQRAFWTAQRDQALDRVRTMVAAQHRDINIAQDWTGELRVPPAVNPDPGAPHTADFGGGVIQGEKGMVTRGCTPVGLGPLGINPPNHDAANPINDHSNHVFEITWTHGDGGTYYCETSPSRDTYAGLTFGLLTAFDMVGPDQPALRAQIRDDILAMASFLVKYGWSYPRPSGYVGTHSDEDGFLSPLMPHVPMARLNIANAARHVADAAGTSADRQKWDAVWDEELASQGPILGTSMDIDAMMPNQGYFKFNLHHLTGFNLMRTLTGTERDVIARGFAVMDKTTRDDINAHFEAITYALTGETSRRDAAVTHLMQWLTYRANTGQGQNIANSASCSQIGCVPEDQAEFDVEQAPGGSVTWYPGSPDAPPFSQRAKLRAHRPLPVAQRPPTDFLWQAPPTSLDGQQSPTWREPGIDFLTPYWMLRYYTEADAPALMPLPEWVGPAHS